jgi:phage baseplate assembly protein W
VADLGTDFNLGEDLDANLSLVSGVTGLGQALARRLRTPRGGLWYAPDYGTDLRQYVLAPVFSARAMEMAAAAECRKDERVEAVKARAVQGDDPSSVELTIDVETADGPFALVLNVSAVTVELLRIEAD